jgi:2-keto-4-pentenoate hydratase
MILIKIPRTAPLDMTIRDLAARQLRDYLQGTPGSYFAEDHPLLALKEAYLVQAEVAKLRSAAGDSVAGYKIGCIGSKIRKAFGMTGPIRGLLYNSELHPSGSTVFASRHTCLAIEGEMAVRIGAETQVLCAFPVIELHNYVFRAKVKSLSELVANKRSQCRCYSSQRRGPYTASARFAVRKAGSKNQQRIGRQWSIMEHARWS